MRVINTRPHPDAAALTEVLAGLGHEVIAAPLLEIRFEDRPRSLDLRGVQAVMATSANGVRALAVATEARDVALFAVGDATARAAAELGFARVTSAGADVEALSAAVTAALDPEAGELLHAAGTRVAGDLAGALARTGFATRRVALYEARAVDILPVGAEAALRSGNVDAVVFFSPRTAETFVRLVRDAGLAQACQMVNAYCLSRAVAGEISALQWRGVGIAERPEQESLLNLLSGTAAP